MARREWFGPNGLAFTRDDDGPILVQRRLYTRQHRDYTVDWECELSPDAFIAMLTAMALDLGTSYRLQIEALMHRCFCAPEAGRGEA